MLSSLVFQPVTSSDYSQSSTQPYVWSPAHRDAITCLLYYATAIGCQSNSASSTSCVWWYMHGSWSGRCQPRQPTIISHNNMRSLHLLRKWRRLINWNQPDSGDTERTETPQQPRLVSSLLLLLTAVSLCPSIQCNVMTMMTMTITALLLCITSLIIII